MKHRLIEFLKTLLILLLVLLVAWLALLVTAQGQVENIALVSMVRSTLGMGGTEASYAPAESTTYEAARPDTLVVTTSEGHHTISRSFDAMDTAFENLGRYLSEALGSAGQPQSVTQAQWQQALSDYSVYFHYYGALPLSVLAEWFRVELGDAALEQVQAGQFILAVQEEAVLLYYAWEDAWYCCQTAMEAQALLEQLEGYRPDGSIFAFESSNQSIAALQPLSVLQLTSAPVVTVATSINPVETDSSFVRSTATTLGFNAYSDVGYTTAEGTRIYREGEYELSVTADGLLQFTMRDAAADARISAVSTEPAALLEAARTLLESLTASTLGDAKLYVTGCTQQGEVTTVTFQYFLDGILVQGTAENAATVVFTGADLTELSLYVRSYSLTERRLTLLPAASAAALVQAGQYLTVQYADAGGDTLQCGWIGLQ